MASRWLGVRVQTSIVANAQRDFRAEVPRRGSYWRERPKVDEEISRRAPSPCVCVCFRLSTKLPATAGALCSRDVNDFGVPVSSTHHRCARTRVGIRRTNRMPPSRHGKRYDLCIHPGRRTCLAHPLEKKRGGQTPHRFENGPL